jgi:hypothetical protein
MKTSHNQFMWRRLSRKRANAHEGSFEFHPDYIRWQNVKCVVKLHEGYKKLFLDFAEKAHKKNDLLETEALFTAI